MVPKKSLPKWILIPPAVALLLLLGPLSMRGNTAVEPEAEPAEPAATAAPLAGDGVRALRTPQAPRTPDLWQMCSALVGVLLLGVGGIVLLRRLRGAAIPTRGSALATLRQSLRLSARHTIHAIEFDDRILLVGEHDRGLALIESGRLPGTGEDERAVLARHAAAHGEAAAHDDGAVPKDMLIPRPDAPQKPRLPTPPAIAPATHPRSLNDFRVLLQKAGRS